MIRSASKYFLLVVISLMSIGLWAQGEDPKDLPRSFDEAIVKEHSVRKATLLSTAFPGLGQIYNKKYWKLPILYGGLGASVFFIVDNNQQYNLYLDAFYTRIDSDPDNDQFVNIYSESQLIELQNIYRRWRDLSIIVTVAVYALNVLDAYVDAHLFNYNIDDNLSLKWEPSIFNFNGQPTMGVGVKIQLR